ncbi:hypothetical protein [Prosthecobacter sp.]|uniref:hypothetical protein n=1 Tax=Prosthecobacter sp. TaxID=1965333 RepID=UPI003784FCDB
MRLKVFILLVLAFLTNSLDAATKIRRSNIIQSRLRLLPRGRGTFQSAEQQDRQSIAAAAGLNRSWHEILSDIFSMQFRTTSMYSVADNIFNTQTDPQSDSQYAQFAGISLDAQFDAHWSLSNAFDQSWYYYGRAENASQDFTASTFSQMLSYERTFLDKKLDLNLPLSWSFSRVFDRATGARTLDSYTYRAATEFSWIVSPRITPAWSYEYFYQTAGSPFDFVPNKHKHNFNLGITFSPFKDRKLYLTPAVQYSMEQFIHLVRTDKIWTPSVTLSWQPLNYLAFDVVGSYTNSRSTQDGSSYKVASGMVFMRLFFDW